MRDGTWQTPFRARRNDSPGVLSGSWVQNVIRAAYGARPFCFRPGVLVYILAEQRIQLDVGTRALRRREARRRGARARGPLAWPGVASNTHKATLCAEHHGFCSTNTREGEDGGTGSGGSRTSLSSLISLPTSPSPAYR